LVVAARLRVAGIERATSSKRRWFTGCSQRRRKREGKERGGGRWEDEEGARVSRG
jgi:hypothetical protein